jgi:predicted phage tail protein
LAVGGQRDAVGLAGRLRPYLDRHVSADEVQTCRAALRLVIITIAKWRSWLTPKKERGLSNEEQKLEQPPPVAPY